MRVSKIIRDYVEKTIITKMPYGAPTETYKQHRQCLDDLTSQLNEKVDAYAKELLAGISNLPEGFEIQKSHYSVFECSSWNSPMAIAAATHERQVRKQREKAIETTRSRMQEAARKLDFTLAAQLRDEMLRMMNLLEEKEQ